MVLTCDFKETIMARVQRDPAFRSELLREGVESMLNGVVETGKTVLRNCINATIGFGVNSANGLAGEHRVAGASPRIPTNCVCLDFLSRG